MRNRAGLNMDDEGILYKNAILIDDNQQRHLGNFIISADGSWSAANGDEDVSETIDGSNRLITRSLQNWHTHLAMQLNARDFSDGSPLDEWLRDSIFPTELRLSRGICRVGVAAAAAEMISTGCSFANDMYHFPGEIGPVLANAGLRAKVSGPVTTWPPTATGDDEEAFRRLQNLLADGTIGDGRVSYGVASHSIYTCSEETLLKGRDLALEYDANLHIHVSETRKEVADCFAKHGMYPIEYLDSIDYLVDGKVNCAHGSWAKKNEMRILAARNAKILHCPSSNMKLACGGTLSLPAYLEAGVDVRLGTDGSASNGNGLDVLAEARTAILVQRHDHWNARELTASTAFAMATAGSKDWAVWDLNNIRMHPVGRSNNRHIANLVYNGTDCLDLWVDGNALRRDGKTLTLDETKVIEELNLAVEDYYQDIE